MWTMARAGPERPGPSCSPNTRGSPGGSGVWSTPLASTAIWFQWRRRSVTPGPRCRRRLGSRGFGRASKRGPKASRKPPWIPSAPAGTGRPSASIPSTNARRDDRLLMRSLLSRQSHRGCGQHGRRAVVVLAHTASSYANGFANEPALVERLSSLTGAPGVTAAGAVRAALQHLGAKRLALGTPYQESVSLQGRAYWQAAGFEIVGYRRLGDVGSIYDETEERAYDLARLADAREADAVLLSGTGLPTIGVLERLERDLGKPVVSSIQACLWQALRVAGRPQPIAGFGRLLRDVAR